MPPPQRSANVITSTSKPSTSLSSKSSRIGAATKRKPTEQQIKSNLALLASIPHPLPPTLPPSPPQSRHNSPVPQKRKRESDNNGHDLTPSPRSDSKRPRLDATASPPVATTLEATRITPSSSQTSSSSSPSSVPDVKPLLPRKKRHLTPDQLRSISDEISNRAVALKKSADARLRTIYDSANPLTESAIARESLLFNLELTDSVVHFLYSFWAKDDLAHSINNARWKSLPPLLKQCEKRWAANAATNGRDRAMAGLLALIAGSSADRAAIESLRLSVNQAKEAAVAQPPNVTQQPPQPAKPPQATQVPSPSTSSASPSSTITESNLPPGFIDTMINSANNSLFAMQKIGQGHSELSLNTLSRLFPRTFEICIKSEITSRDTHDVDFYACQKGNGTWAWPVHGNDAIPHIAGFASSLLWEYGEMNGGYRGYSGCGQTY